MIPGLPDPPERTERPACGLSHEQRLDRVRTYVSALLSVSVIGAVIMAQFTLGTADAGPLTGWGGAVIGYWLGARSSGNGESHKGRF